MIRTITKDDHSKIIELAKTLGFDDNELKVVEEILEEYFVGDDTVKWFVAAEGDVFVGVLYYAKEVMTQDTWNALMLLVDPDSQGEGYGRELMEHAESELKQEGARLLVVETSSFDDFERARKFYIKSGFKLEATISEFYSEGEDKIVFSKLL